MIAATQASAPRGGGHRGVYLQPVQDLQIDSRASRTQFQYTLEDADPDQLGDWAPRVLARLQALPELRDVASDQQSSGLQLQLTIDRDTASRLGILPQAIDDVLYDAFGQRQVSTIFTQLNQYRVILEVKPDSRRTPTALEQHLRARAVRRPGAALEPSPTSSRHARPLAITHQGQFPAVTLSFNIAPGLALGDAVDAIHARRAPRSACRPACAPTLRAPRRPSRSALASEPFLILAALAHGLHRARACSTRATSTR